MRIILELTEDEQVKTLDGKYVGTLNKKTDNYEIYVDTKFMKEYVSMVKDLKESGFTSEEIIELIGKVGR